MSDSLPPVRVERSRDTSSSEAETSARADGASAALGTGSRLSANRTEGEVGTLSGIARHMRPKAPMETVDHATVTLEAGIVGDFRGAMKGKPYRRQVTLIERGDWEAATGEVGHSIPWEERRANLLVDGLDLPQVPKVRLRIGADVVLEITRETDPCERMEALAPGLKAALSSDWRGGVCTMVIQGGAIAVGDEIRIER